MEESREYESIAERTKARIKPIDVDASFMSDECPAEKKDSVEVVLNPEEQSLESDVNLKPNKSIKAERYLELIAAGEPEHRAARFVGSTVRDMNKDPDMKAAVKRLIEEWGLPEVMRKFAVKASLNKILMENIDKPKGHKLALQAAKQIAMDSDTGLNQAPQGASVNIDLGALGNLLQELKPIKGLENVLEGDTEKDL